MSPKTMMERTAAKKRTRMIDDFEEEDDVAEGIL
jgi:hypothetical protein